MGGGFARQAKRGEYSFASEKQAFPVKPPRHVKSVFRTETPARVEGFLRLRRVSHATEPNATLPPGEVGERSAPTKKLSRQPMAAGSARGNP